MKTNITFKNTTIECTCNALTPILYREIFKKDFFEQLLSFTKVKSYDKIVENKPVSGNGKNTAVADDPCLRFGHNCE